MAHAAALQFGARSARRPIEWMHRPDMGSYNRRCAPERGSCARRSADPSPVTRHSRTHPGGQVTKRTRLLLGALATVALVSILVQVLAHWDGAREHRSLSAGERVELESGLAFTVPSGWHGLLTKYWAMPDWTPIGGNAALLGVSEDLELSSRDATGSIRSLSVRDYYGRAVPPTPIPRPSKVVAQSRDVTIYEYEGRPRFVRVVTRIPSRRIGYVDTRIWSGEPTSALQGVWAAARVVGTSLP